MLELTNVSGLVVLVLVSLAAFYALFSRLIMSPVHWQLISSHVPSATKTPITALLVSWNFAFIHPKDLLPYFMDLFKKHGPVVHLNLGGYPYVLLNDPDDIKILLSSHTHVQKGTEYSMIKPWLNEGLLLSTGSKWQNRRKLLTKAFHFKTLDMYIPSVNKHSKVLVEKLLENFSSEKEISLINYVTLCSLDIMCETIMGTEMNAQKGKSVEYVNSIKSACRSVIERIFKFWLWNDLLFAISGCGRTFYTSIKVLHSFTDNVIKNKRKLLNDSKNETKQSMNNYKNNFKKCFLDLLLNILDEYPETMTDMDVREEVDTFLFEGHDTSSLSMTITLLLLGIYQDIQDKVRNELYYIFGDSDRDATMEDLIAMKYLEAVIKESLRLYPSVPAFTRELQTTLHLKKYNIPPNTTITVYPYILHRNEDIFQNAEEFNPERFLSEEDTSKMLFGYIPFSAGARNCIGQKYAMNQMKTVISTVLRRTKIETLGSREDIQTSMELVLRLESVPNVKFCKI